MNQSQQTKGNVRIQIRPVAEVAAEHAIADKACGREWECTCGACNIQRKKDLQEELRRSNGVWTATAEMISRNIINR